MMKERIILCFVLIISCGLFLFGCSNNEEVESSSEEGEIDYTFVLDDILQNDSTYNDYGLELGDVFLKEDSSDNTQTTFKVNAESNSNEYNYAADYIIEYKNNNNSKELIGFKTVSHDFKLNEDLKDRSQSDAKVSTLGYLDTEYWSKYSDENRIVFEYLACKREDGWLYDCVVSIPYEYSKENGFTEGKSEEEVFQKSPDCTGEWVYQGGERDYKVKIFWFDIKKKYLYTAYDLYGVQSLIDDKYYHCQLENDEMKAKQLDQIDGSSEGDMVFDIYDSDFKTSHEAVDTRFIRIAFSNITRKPDGEYTGNPTATIKVGNIVLNKAADIPVGTSLKNEKGHLPMHNRMELDAINSVSAIDVGDSVESGFDFRFNYIQIH